MGLAIIGGSGFGVLGEATTWQEVETPYGVATLAKLDWSGRPVVFCARHGSQHSWPPHRINYRANIWALWHLKIERIIATATVGALHVRGAGIGDLVLIDQFLDFTSRRSQTFFQGPTVVHVDLTEPYCPQLRQELAGRLSAHGLSVRNGGCYVCTEGPRYETSAEVRAMAQLGGDVVGMTGVPEAVLAREAGLCYATVALISNWGAGIESAPLDHQTVLSSMQSCYAKLAPALQEVVTRLEERHCPCPPRAQLPAVSLDE